MAKVDDRGTAHPLKRGKTFAGGRTLLFMLIPGRRKTPSKI